jgi:general secretion pathway protein A
MYNEYFGLKEAPFSIAPDPRYLFMSGQHREALAHLVYGFNSDGGFVMLTGEVGTGKTTVCRCLLEQIPDNTAIAFILNPKLTVPELLATVCDEFGIKYPQDNTSIKVFVDLINAYLLEAHTKNRKAVLLIDEAQNLSAEVLEQLRLLTNLETSQRKLLQIILIGQPELRDKLSEPGLRQLSQRIIARYHLGSLSKKDISAYVSHRLSVAGLRDQLFPAPVINKLYRLTGGVPRLINVVCDRALLGTYAMNKNLVSTATLTKAAHEVFGESRPLITGLHRKAAVWIIFSAIIAVGAVVAATYYKEEKQVTAPKETSNIKHSPPVKESINKKPEPAVETIKPDIIETIKLRKLSWPADQPADKSSVMAFQELFKLWGLAYQQADNVSACTQAEGSGLKCFTGNGNLLRLRNINIPAILKFSDSGGSVYYAVLTGLSDDTARILVGTEVKEVPVKDVEASWLGEYTLLWRPAPDFKDIIKPGMQGAIVQWLETRLSVFDGKSNTPRENPEYDNEMAERVKKFQLANGLVPDGIVGTQTMIHLSPAAGDKPVLDEKQKDG